MLAYENYPFVSIVRDNMEIIDILYPKFYKAIKKIMITEKNLMATIS